MIGNSMGGFGAMLFGAMTGADEVHAFAPQTFVDPAQRARHADGRWPEQMRVVHSLGGPRYHDLRPVLDAREGGGSTHVHFSPDEPLDAVHAEHLRGLRDVHLHSYSVTGHGHNLVRFLRDEGTLQHILDGALGVAGP
jgi:hypothetical protein